MVTTGVQLVGLLTCIGLLLIGLKVMAQRTHVAPTWGQHGTALLIALSKILFPTVAARLTGIWELCYRYLQTLGQAPPTATTTITNNQIGVVEYDVTADVQSFVSGTSNYGWIIKKTAEGQNGMAQFGTKESSSTPQLIVTYQP